MGGLPHSGGHRQRTHGGRAVFLGRGPGYPLRRAVFLGRGPGYPLPALYQGPGVGPHQLRNHDRFLFTTPLARGGKTGYTRAAKHTYVGRFAHRDKEIIIALMRSKKKWADLRTLIEKGFALAGAPIPKLPPREEKLWSGKKVRKSKRYRKSKRKRRHHTRHKKRRTSRKRAKVIVGASTSLPTKAKIIKRSP